MNTHAKYSQPISNTSMAWLLVSICFTALPHLLRLPLLISVTFITVLLLSTLIHLKLLPAPNKPLRLVLTIIVVLMVFFSHGTLIGQDAGISLLVAMCAIKLLEVFKQRDVYITVLIGFFVLITHFFSSYSLGLMLYLSLCLLLLFSTLLEISRCNSVPASHIKSNVYFSASIIFQALPFMLILFFFFPRIPSPLWGLQDTSFSASTGLTDSMEIGTIGSLSQSNAIAFRAEFTDSIPIKSSLYWRGPVLTYTNGRSWHTKAPTITQEYFISSIPFTKTSRTLEYTITMEPSKNPWIFALDLPTSVPLNSRLTTTYQLIYNDPINNPIRYKATSALSYQLNTSYSQEISESLQLPDTVNPLTVAYGKQLRQEFTTSQEIIQAALKNFNKNEFSYTLNPRVINSSNPIDAFLFETKQGFCEHYSAAFTVIMRAAGIPTRVVTGYQGGEINPFGDYLIVRQRDAHAWTEVWLDNIGWTRIDPTSVIAPDRIESGSTEMLMANNQQPIFSLYNPKLSNLLYSLDWINNKWNQWVINYDQKQQNNFFEDLGLENWSQVILTMMLLLMLVCLVIAFYIIYKHRLTLPPQHNAWQKLCAKLANIGLHKQPYEGPTDYYRRIIKERPDLSASIQPIFEAYVKIIYASENCKSLERYFKHAIKEFRPTNKKPL